MLISQAFLEGGFQAAEAAINSHNAVDAVLDLVLDELARRDEQAERDQFDEQVGDRFE